MAQRTINERPVSVRAFTLTELMIAIVILIVVILATSQIFSTASRVAGVGKGTADVLTETGVIQRQMQQDLEALDPSGFFAIRCVAVRNDINLPIGPLLNPLLPEQAVLRADQLVFFRTGAQSIQMLRAGEGTSHKGQSTSARVYYGHAFQLPEGPAADVSPLLPPNGFTLARDPIISSTIPHPWYAGIDGGILPWHRDAGVQSVMVDTRYQDAAGAAPGEYDQTPATPISAVQPSALQWLLARQSVAMTDDGGEMAVFLGGNRSAFTLFAPRFPGDTLGDEIIRQGRVDAVAMQMNDVRDTITIGPTGPLPWSVVGTLSQRDIIRAAIYYPRAERRAPSMNRVDQALTNSALGSACSSFIIDWMYEDGVGEASNGLGVTWRGAFVPSYAGHPWFGLDFQSNGDLATAGYDASQQVVTTNGVRGVVSFTEYSAALPAAVQPQTLTVLPHSTGALPGNTIEQVPLNVPTQSVYEAFFGFNRDQPLGPPVALAPAGTYTPASLPPVTPDAEPRSDIAYTPWPSAIRVTMTLHDVNGRLESGREVQFVIKLPKRGRQ